MDDEIYNSAACNCADPVELREMTMLSSDQDISVRAREVQNSELLVNAHE
ncbi:hypothetical protein [Rhizobium tumorigenes]|nr:hypothetical protein [Rhizobium tumorigenes]WFS04360.1 hypothetical protein PR016_26535 [Rhizobium tumorigenes]